MQEADKLTVSRNWRAFALFLMQCRATTAGDLKKAAACLRLLEREVNAMTADELFGG
jgi:hypothetical protein